MASLAANNVTIAPDYFATKTRCSIDEYLDFFNCLTEEEISDILKKIVERYPCGEGLEESVSLLNALLRFRHFSEKFLMEQLGNVSKTESAVNILIQNILILHKADIATKAYPELALYLEMRRNG